MDRDPTIKSPELETPLRRRLHRITGMLVVLSSSAVAVFLIEWFSVR
jgi:hypothetical protein